MWRSGLGRRTCQVISETQRAKAVVIFQMPEPRGIVALQALIQPLFGFSCTGLASLVIKFLCA